MRILADNHPLTNIVLEHYGLTRDAVEGWGGEILSAGEALPDGDGGSDIFGREVDIIVHNQTYLANTPEARLWYHYSQHQSLRYLPLDQPLLERMQSEFQLERVSVPEGLLRGLEQPFETVARSGQVVYGRDDMPEPFAYLLAQAMDEESRRFIWTMMPLSYNQRTAAQTLDVPLHPGAARYYRERGYPTQP